MPRCAWAHTIVPGWSACCATVPARRSRSSVWSCSPPNASSIGCPRIQRDGATALTLTPLELIDPLAALIPPPRRRHRYHGVLAPNAPLRAAAAVYGRDAPGSLYPPSNVTASTSARRPASVGEPRNPKRGLPQFLPGRARGLGPRSGRYVLGSVSGGERGAETGARTASARSAQKKCIGKGEPSKGAPRALSWRVRPP